MNSTALMLLLGLVGTVWSAPVCDPQMKPNCSSGCEWTAGHQMSDFKHVSELHDSSVAPWDLISKCRGMLRQKWFKSVQEVGRYSPVTQYRHFYVLLFGVPGPFLEYRSFSLKLEDTQLDREPQHIDMARCRPCKVEGKTAKEIVLQVSVYEKICNGSGVVWCKCPFKLAVGCTCVSEQ